MTYDQACETFRFAWRNERAFRFDRFSASSRPQSATARFIGRFSSFSRTLAALSHAPLLSSEVIYFTSNCAFAAASRFPTTLRVSFEDEEKLLEKQCVVQTHEAVFSMDL